MIFAGIDIGSRAAKAVIMEDGDIIGSTIEDTGPESVKTAYKTIEEANILDREIHLDPFCSAVARSFCRTLTVVTTGRFPPKIR